MIMGRELSWKGERIAYCNHFYYSVSTHRPTHKHPLPHQLLHTSPQLGHFGQEPGAVLTCVCVCVCVCVWRRTFFQLSFPPLHFLSFCPPRSKFHSFLLDSLADNQEPVCQLIKYNKALRALSPNVSIYLWLK